MELSIRREELVRGLHLLQGVPERPEVVPLLSHVLVDPAEDRVALTATDMGVGLRIVLPAEVRTGGAIMLDARKLYEIARQATAEEVVLTSAQTPWVDLLTGRTKFRLGSVDPKEFPVLPLGPEPADGAAIAIPARTLAEMIDKTLFAVSRKPKRISLSGVLLSTPEGGTLRMVATDGTRLALIDRPVADIKLDRGVIVPRRGLVEIRKLLDEIGDDEVTLAVSATHLRLSTSLISFFARLVDAEFPDYQACIPAAIRARARARREDLLAALRHVAPLADPEFPAVRFQFDRGRLKLSAGTPEREASEELNVAYDGEPLTIGFNLDYFLAVLGVLREGEVVEVGLTEGGPAILRASGDPDYTYVVMPVRL